MKYSGPFERLINELEKMPGVGHKSAQRLAFYLLSLDNTSVTALTEAIKEVKEKIKYCTKCYNLSTDENCDICGDRQRDQQKLCVVAEPKDLIAMERTGLYKGIYHILGGLISPINGIGPDALRIKELLQRLQKEKITEVICAFNPNVEGEATILYLLRLLKHMDIKVTRIAYGLPVGSDMDYADENTLSKAYEGRVCL